MTAPGATPAAGPTQGHPERAAEPAPDGWGPRAVPSAEVLARIAAVDDPEYVNRLLWMLLRDSQRQAAAMAEALGALAHDFVPAEYYPLRCDVCTRKRDLPEHRTPAVVQARLDAEATP